MSLKSVQDFIAESSKRDSKDHEFDNFSVISQPFQQRNPIYTREGNKERKKRKEPKASKEKEARKATQPS